MMALLDCLEFRNFDSAGVALEESTTRSLGSSRALARMHMHDSTVIAMQGEGKGGGQLLTAFHLEECFDGGSYDTSTAGYCTRYLQRR